VNIINSGLAPGFGVEIKGINITVGAPGAPAEFLNIQAGSASAPAGIQRGDAILNSTGSLIAYLSGDLTLKGGAATVTGDNKSQASAIALLAGVSTTLNVGGNMVLNGGTSLAQGGVAATTLDVGADSSAYINSPMAPGGLTATIGGSLTATAGNATASVNEGRASASATLSGSTIAMTAGTGIKLTGNMATADVGAGTGNCMATGGYCATAAALINSGTKTAVTSNAGGIILEGGTAMANGTAGTANALAGIVDHAPTQLNTVMTITSSGANVQLTAGPQTVVAGGIAKSDATILSGGGIELIGGVALSGASTGLFQALNAGSTGTTTNIISLDGSVPPITLKPMSLTRIGTLHTGNAFIISGSPPSNLDPLLSGLLSSINALTTLLVKSGTVSTTPASSSKANYCK
jgi:hypothetical protein